MKPWLELLRISNLPTVWTNLIAGAVFASAFEGLVTTVALGIVLVAGSCLYLAGMVLNDVFDAAIDASERPSRPIPSGRVSARAASVVGWGLLLVGAGLPWLVSMIAGVIAIAIACLVVLYDRVHARTAWSVVFMGLCRWGLYLLGAAGTVAMAPPAAPGAFAANELAIVVTGLAAFPVLVHVASFSMVARGEVPDLRPACPTCGQIVLDDATTCPECGDPCDETRRIARTEARREVAHHWWCTGTMGLVLPFLGCCGVVGLVAANQGLWPAKDGAWILGLSLLSAVVLGWYLIDSARHLHRHPQAVGRFVLRSIAVLCLFDAALVASVLPRALGKATGVRIEVIAALVACLACLALVRWAHRRIPGT